MTRVKTKPALDATKKTSRYWSKKEVKQLIAIVKGEDRVMDGIKKAAEHFGVSATAITVKYYSSIKGIRTKREDRNTTKDYKYKKSSRTGKRGPYNKRSIADSLGAMTGKITLNIKNVELDLAKGKIHLEY